MYVVTVRFSIHPDRIDDFLPLMLENARASLRDEPGCRQFDVCRDPNSPSEIFLYEIYDDEAAFKAHTEMPHFISFDAAVASLVADKQVAIYDRLPT